MTFRASQIERLSLCPGSGHLEAQCPDEPSAESDFGTAVHKAACGSINRVKLPLEQQECLDRLMAKRFRLVTSWNGSAKVGYLERSLSMWDGLLTGHPDEYIVEGLRALIIDYKTIQWGEHAPSPENLQLRSYCLLVDEEHGPLDEITVAIIQDGHEPAPCVYTREDLAVARLELVRILETARLSTGDGPFNPGEVQCRFCRGKVICPALKDAAIEMRQGIPTKIAATVIAENLPADLLAAQLNLSGPVQWYLDAIKAEGKRRLDADPESVPGWTLKEGRKIRTITDIVEVCERMADKGIPWEEIAKACDIGFGEIEGLVEKHVGGRRKPIVDAILDGCIETKTAAPSLVRAKEAIE
jgi:hypothetical protein